MSSTLRTIGSYFGFLTSAAPQPVTTTDGDGNVTTTLVAPPTSYVTPDVVETYTLIATVTLGGAASSSGTGGSVPAAFSDFPLALLDFNPPLSAFSVSKIKSVSIRVPPLPRDVDWYAAIWATLPTQNRTFDHIRRRAPNVFWVWRSNVTVPQPIEHTVPWPSGRPIGDSLHANLAGLHPPSLQIGCNNAVPGASTPLTAGIITMDVIIEVEVAGRGLFGNL